MPECHKIKKGGLDQYGTERFGRLILPQSEKMRMKGLKFGCDGQIRRRKRQQQITKLSFPTARVKDQCVLQSCDGNCASSLLS